MALFFCAAGLWFTGVVQKVSWLTTLAMAALAVAMVLGILGRRRHPGESIDVEDEDDAEGDADFSAADDGPHLSSAIPDR